MGREKSVSATPSGKSGKKGKFYAVHTGHKPGVYSSWPDAEAQTIGFPYAKHQKFNTFLAAEEFVKTGVDTSAEPTYYGVRVGRYPGVYTDLETAQEQIAGFRTPIEKKWKKCRSEEEAWEFVRSKEEVSTPISLRGDLESTASTDDARKGGKISNIASKRQKRNDGSALALVDNHGEYPPATGPLPLDAEDGFDGTVTFNPLTGEPERKTEEQLGARKMQPTGSFSGTVEIYTDGSSLGNGQKGAVAGVGVYFGNNDERNVSEPLVGDSQTNQRAELVAIQRALDIAPIDRDVLIYSDSNYAIKCVTEWFIKWRENSAKAKAYLKESGKPEDPENPASTWLNSSGEKVSNEDVIKAIINRIDERMLARGKTNFQWIKGHANHPGNVAADTLAVNGAREARYELTLLPTS
ncbi:ribonuclease H-like domain-containing protein [Massariosphaeria phaeospora]|uniref:Ribonuclease H n=1 Tax=Massariosphaeria phaeospora TaxID=100035 RepID=A0A7C8MIH2_9PLEO|nr:ribonuclease H-like domain-containing protein [Massariosphaeria phaeospora]